MLFMQVKKEVLLMGAKRIGSIESDNAFQTERKEMFGSHIIMLTLSVHIIVKKKNA